MADLHLGFFRNLASRKHRFILKTAPNARIYQFKCIWKRRNACRKRGNRYLETSV